MKTKNMYAWKPEKGSKLFSMLLILINIPLT